MSPDCDCDAVAVVDPGTQQTLAISLNHLISGVLSQQLQQQLQQKQYNKANQVAGLAFYGKLSRLCGRRRKMRRRGGANATCDLADCGKQLANKAKDNSSSSSNSSDSKRKQKQAGRERECEREEEKPLWQLATQQQQLQLCSCMCVWGGQKSATYFLNFISFRLQLGNSSDSSRHFNIALPRIITYTPHGQPCAAARCGW